VDQVLAARPWVYPAVGNCRLEWLNYIKQFITNQNTKQAHTKSQITQDCCRPGQSEKNDEEVKGERGVKVRSVQGGKGQEGRREGKESWKQAESEEEEEGGETEQQRQDSEGGGEKAKDEKAGERRSDRQGRSGGQGCGQRHIHKLPQVKTAVVTSWTDCQNSFEQ
jgi:hypothetical protein